ncbi:MAG: DNA polymerase III subunit gamma/tau [Patescibacteria group bacterium]
MKAEEKTKKDGQKAANAAIATTRIASHSALYRKYRPASFADVLGQEQVVKALEGAIGAAGKAGASSGARPNISHAYLFSGSRGTGKTSVARIFAQTIGTSANDLYEIDAASNRGIDDVRELREAVNTLPFESPYKVYIIDEVHMLTKEAFNALLKTLEEPPAHVVFILATTDSEKLPQTVVSRCQTFVFKKPGTELLKESVLRVSKAEGFKVAAEAAELIALLGDSSYRDTLGVLQKVLGAVGEKSVTLEDVERVTSAPRAKLVQDFILGLGEGSAGGAEKALAVIRQMQEHGVDMRVFVTLVLQKVRFILLMRMSAEMEKIAKEQFSEAEFAFLKKCAGDAAGAKINSKVVLELLTALEQTGSSPIPQLPLELAVLRLVGEGGEKK